MGRAEWTSERSIRLSAPSAGHARAIVEVLKNHHPDWMTDVVASSRSVLVVVDQASVTPDRIETDIEECLDVITTGSLRLVQSHEHTIPACYHPDLAPDLMPCASRLGVTVQEFIAIHSGAVYTADTIGFSPGFAYLGGLPRELVLPRKEIPLSRVPPGSVAIAGTMTAVYPHATPGGWRLIARTPSIMFDPMRDPASLLSQGDTVRFTPVSIDEFERLQGENSLRRGAFT